MADEINRASQDPVGTVAGDANTRCRLRVRIMTCRSRSMYSQPRTLELEGTNPLPEAQLDRFLLQIDVEYRTKRLKSAC